MRQALYTLCALLLLALPIRVAQAAETLDEKVYDPGQRLPAVDTPAPDARVVPGRPIPGQMGPGQTGPGDTIIVVPGTQGRTLPGQVVPGQPDDSAPRILVPETVRPETVTPDAVQPETVRPDMVRPETVRPDALQKETPTIVTPVPLPQLPKTPETEKKDIIVTPVQPVQSVPPGKPENHKAPAQPNTNDHVILTPADFLPLTPNSQERVKPEAKPAPKKDGKLEAKPDAPKEAKPDPKKDSPKDKPAPEKKKGDILRIPPDAARTGKKDFLEGCWKGTVTGSDGRDVRDDMGSRVCFDANGNGKHSLYDPGKKETCVGPAKGVVSGDNLLRVDYDKMQCPSGKTWYPQGDRYMTCRDAGTGAQCSWHFGGSPDVGVRFYKD